MSDTDRLTAYIQRMENPEHRRDLDDGCGGCSHSAVFCRCVTYIEGAGIRCCPACTH